MVDLAEETDVPLDSSIIVSPVVVQPLPGAHPMQARGIPTYPTSDPRQQAGPGAQAGASLSTDIETRIRYFASKRFPYKTLPDAMSHYGLDNGRIYYISEQGGEKFYEEPAATDIISKNPVQGLTRNLASLTGPSLPVVGAVGGAVASTFAGGIPGAALGAVAGDALRQQLASGITGDQSGYQWTQGLYEGLLGATGQGLGRLAILLKNSRLAKDIERLGRAGVEDAINALRQAATREGIQLTPAEITELRSLVNQQRVVADSLHGADTLADFNKAREVSQIRPAIDRRMGEISSQESAELGARNLVAGAEGTIAGAKATRRAAVDPFYKRAYAEGTEVDVSEALAKIDDLLANRYGDNSTVSGALKKVRLLLTRYEETLTLDDAGKTITSTENVPETSLQKLHNSLIEIGERIRGTPLNPLGTSTKRALTQVQTLLRTALEDQSPEFAAAQARFKAESPPVDALTGRGQGVGVVSNLEGIAVSRAPKTIFEQGPQAIRSDRAAFMKAGQEAEWNAGLRSYLQDILDKASKETAEGTEAVGSRFYVATFGSQKVQRNLKAAMTANQFEGFRSLMQVLKATGRVARGGSPTHFKTEAAAQGRRDSASKIAEGVGTLTEPWTIPRRLVTYWNEISYGKHNAKLAEIIVDPKNMEMLRELRRLSPGNVRAWEVTAQLLTQLGASGVETLADYATGETRQPTLRTGVTR